MPEDRISWTIIASLLRPQGRKGELLANLFTDFPDRFRRGDKVFLARPQFKGVASDAISLKIESSWLPHGRNEGRIVLSFCGVNTIEEAERLSGLDILVPETERIALEDDEVYVDALIGCTLFDGDVAVGTIRDVQFTMTADGRRRLTDAAPLLTVDLESGEALVPFAKEFIVTQDLEGKRLVMKLPEGLIGLNVKPSKPSS